MRHPLRIPTSVAITFMALLPYGSDGRAVLLPDTPAWTIEGVDYDRLGWSVSSAGDVNLDGYDDVLVLSLATEFIGRAYLYLGSSGGLIGPAWSASAIAAAGAGDVNGDGYDDVIVGSTSVARGLVYAGGSAGLSTEPTWGVLPIPLAGGGYLRAAGAGDVNGDGFDDVLLSDFTISLYSCEGPGGPFPGFQGKAYLFFGSSTGPHPDPDWNASGAVCNSALGYKIHGAADVNSDGYADFIVTMRNSSSGGPRANLYFGSPSGPGQPADWSTGLFLDTAEAGAAGDVNGDGFADLIVENEIFFGSPSGPATTPSWSAAPIPNVDFSFGSAAATAGDINHDGYADIVIGAPRYANGEATEGAVFLYVGSPSGPSTQADWFAEGNRTGGQFGFSVASAGDVDGDGYDDILVGAPDPFTPPQHGRAFLFGNLHCLDTDGDQVGECNDNCPAVYNPTQADADLDSVGDACDNCPTISNPDRNPCVCGACYPLDITITFASDFGKGSGVVAWRTGIEWDLSGFNVVIVDNKGNRIQQNPATIPCEQCVTGLGHSYSFVIPKHKSGQSIFVEQVHLDGRIDRFGPATRR